MRHGNQVLSLGDCALKLTLCDTQIYEIKCALAFVKDVQFDFAVSVATSKKELWFPSLQRRPH
jgi:hypothetical protein